MGNAKILGWPLIIFMFSFFLIDEAYCAADNAIVRGVNHAVDFLTKSKKTRRNERLAKTAAVEQQQTHNAIEQQNNQKATQTAQTENYIKAKTASYTEMYASWTNAAYTRAAMTPNPSATLHPVAKVLRWVAPPSVLLQRYLGSSSDEETTKTVQAVGKGVPAPAPTWAIDPWPLLEETIVRQFNLTCKLEHDGISAGNYVTPPPASKSGRQQSTYRHAWQFYADSPLEDPSYFHAAGNLEGEVVGLMVGVYPNGSFLALAPVKDNYDRITGYNLLYSRCAPPEFKINIDEIKLTAMILPELNKSNLHWLTVDQSMEDLPLIFVTFPAVKLQDSSAQDWTISFYPNHEDTQLNAFYSMGTMGIQKFYSSKLNCPGQGVRYMDWITELKNPAASQIYGSSNLPSGELKNLTLGKDSKNNLVSIFEGFAQDKKMHKYLAFSWCPGDKKEFSVEYLEGPLKFNVEDYNKFDANKIGKELGIGQFRLMLKSNKVKNKRQRLVLSIKPFK